MTPATAKASAGPAELREPAGEESADRREPEEREEVEADESAAQVVGRGELDECVRVRREERERDPDPEEDDAGEVGVLDGRERDREHAERGGADGEESPARTAERRRDERADESAGPEGGGQEAEALGPHVQRVGREKRHEDVEVEADGRDDGDDAEDQSQLGVAPGEARSAPKAADDGRAAILRDRMELVLANESRAR